VGEGQNSFAKELVKHSLLSANDEMGLSRQYKLGVQILAQQKLMGETMGRQVSDEELAMALEIPSDQVSLLIEKGEAAKKILVRANMRLVFHIAKYFRYRGVAYPDLVQEGTFGLIKAVDKYDPERGFRFSTYASWWIKQSVSRAIAEKSRIVRLPVHIHDLMVSISKAEKQFIMQYARKPSAEELAETMALPLQKVQLLLKCGRGVNSMDEAVFQSKAGMPVANEVQVKDRIASEGSQPSLLNEKNSVRSELRRAMRILSVREAEIIEMRFGLGDGNPMTLEEIGKHFNVTRERIRQIESRALSKMRHPDHANELKENLQDYSFERASFSIEAFSSNDFEPASLSSV
jgi:RNA polymerase sigma factor (sigma-70 family)